MFALLLIANIYSTCIYPSKLEGELSGIDSISCFSSDSTISERILADLDFENEALTFVMSNDPDGVYYVLANGKYRQTHLIDNGPDDFHEGLVRTIQNKKYGFMDSSLKVVIEPKWDFAYPFNGHYARVCNSCFSTRHPGDEHSIITGGQWFLIDRSGKETNEINKKRRK